MRRENDASSTTHTYLDNRWELKGKWVHFLKTVKFVEEIALLITFYDLDFQIFRVDLFIFSLLRVNFRFN